MILLLFVFFVACFFPYPSLPIGNFVGLQACHVLALAILACRPAEVLSSRSTTRVGLLLVPVLISVLAVFLRGDVVEQGLALSNLLALVVFTLPLATTALLGRWALDPLMAAACGAIVVHAFVGAIQYASFMQGSFPFEWLYVNPSFRPIDELTSGLIDQRRLCGLFPEPSAMAASLGPWIVLALGLSLRPASLRWSRTALACSACGAALMLGSRSGFLLALAPAIVVVLLTRRWDRTSLARVFVLAAIALLAIGVAVFLLGGEERFNVEQNSSWQLRLTSLLHAWDMVIRSPSTLCFGVGYGLSSYAISNELGGLTIAGTTSQVTAVWSIVGRYLVETGLLGLVAVLYLLRAIVANIFRSSQVSLGFITLGVWAFGVTFTTSYLALAPVWLFLCVLLQWDRVFK